MYIRSYICTYVTKFKNNQISVCNIYRNQLELYFYLNMYMYIISTYVRKYCSMKNPYLHLIKNAIHV